MDAAQQDEQRAAPARPAKVVVVALLAIVAALAVRPSPRALTRSARTRRRRALLRAPRRTDGLEGRCEPAVVRPSRLHRDLPARHRLPRPRGPVPRRAPVRGSALASRHGSVNDPTSFYEIGRLWVMLLSVATVPLLFLRGTTRVRRPHRDRRRVLLGTGPVGGELRQHCPHRRRRRVLRPALALAVSRRARRPASAPVRARRRGDRSCGRVAVFHGRARSGARRGVVDRAVAGSATRDAPDTAHRAWARRSPCSRSRRRSSSSTGTRCRARSRPRPSARSPTIVRGGWRTSATTPARRFPTRFRGWRRCSRSRASRSRRCGATPDGSSSWDSAWSFSA